MGAVSLSLLLDLPVQKTWMPDPPGPKLFSNTFDYNPSSRHISIIADAKGWGSGGTGYIKSVTVTPLLVGALFPGLGGYWNHVCYNESSRTCAEPFDSECYAHFHDDVVKAGLNTPELLCCHYNVAGRAEGRKASCNNDEL
jgi:hypothetical protein